MKSAAEMSTGRLVPTPRPGSVRGDRPERARAVSRAARDEIGMDPVKRMVVNSRLSK